VLIGTTSGNALGVAAPAGRVPGQPFSVATLDRETINQGEAITFDASGSYDDGQIVSYFWDFGDGTTATGPHVTHTFANEGVYVVVLTVTDNQGKKDRRSWRVTVKGTPPVANPGGPYVLDETVAIAGRWSLALDGSASYDAETSLRYE
jgi:PKD repeat protein